MSGDGEDYSDDEINDVYDAISDAWEDHTGGGPSSSGGAAGGGGAAGASGGGGGAAGAGGGGAAPGGGGLGAIVATGNGSANGKITVTAKVEWAGEYANNGRGGERTVRLGFDRKLDTRPVVKALKKAQRLEVAAARGPLRTYGAKTTEAKLRQLGGTKAGRAALREAGYTPSRWTAARHARGETKPNKAYENAINQAYENKRNPGRGVMAARREVADALTSSLRAAYDGQNIRFRDIRSMNIS